MLNGVSVPNAVLLFARGVLLMEVTISIEFVDQEVANGSMRHPHVGIMQDGPEL